ncbi:glycoside hydrolase family 3 N-terminal domain-containing protein [Quadrisphaera sp. DSM 44207]|uniref:beta-xylosidase/alpha-l-arabinosidase n=1 Tax=Quadrisphaera sp. DSM 44207 TaxID=1881057 RepID=UPI0008886474|nr:glycoside hydrolase family 3 N-terminal domain-containing protein [Quadrisphaera sp. DSM 44207]SDQ64939.1 beta-glucosidase [Quadrisphaera sp. DSM 44207]
MSTDLSPSTGLRRPEGATARVEELLASMTLEEKLAQLVGLWEGRGGDGEGGDVAPMQDAMQSEDAEFEAFAARGLGQLTRPFGTAPVDPVEGARRLAAKQRWLTQNTRLGVPALVHEECLTGLAAWRATTFPAPLTWGASFHPELVERVGAAIGASMASLGVHQGLAPVLDVVRDARWGRVEECISEDPYVVGTVATAYVRGVQSTGVVATLKHFVGYSNSRAGRNLAPVHAGPREVADVLMLPFEMAVLDGGVDSVMNSYAEVDGLPVAADASLLTGVLRERWGFTGTVVADYFSVAFLQTLHGVAADLGDAASQAISAGIDVELPTGTAYLEPLAEQVRSGQLPEEVVDRALRRVLEQKARLGLLDAAFDPDAVGPIDLDPPEHRELARVLAEEGVVLLSNDATLPLGTGAQGPTGRVAVVGPNADDSSALFGCYSFANHVLAQHPGVELGLRAPTVLEALRAELPSAQVEHVRGCDVDTDDTSGLEAAVAAARGADLCVAVVGDRAGLFGRGTSGEGCDADDLDLPGVQRQLVEALLETGTPVVLVLLTGRPYAVDWALARCAAVVQAFFPGQEGAGAIAGVLSGRVNPSGRLPVSLPRSVGAQPYSYLHPRLGGASSVSNLDTAPVLPFGHGLSYTTFEHTDLRVADAEVPTDGSIRVSVRVANTGERAGADVVQLYATDPVASVTRPVVQLLGYARVPLEAGQSAQVAFDVPTTRLAFSDRRTVRVVEPGTIELAIGTSCQDPVLEAGVELVGPVHEVTTADRRLVDVTVLPDAPQR